MEINIILNIFNIIGSIIAFCLFILKLLEYKKNNPNLEIKYTNCIYKLYPEFQHEGKILFTKGTTVSLNINFLNKGIKPIFISELSFDIYNKNRKKLNTIATLFPLNKRIEPHNYFEKKIKLIYQNEFSKEEDYYLKIFIKTSYKSYKTFFKINNYYTFLKESDKFSDKQYDGLF